MKLSRKEKIILSNIITNNYKYIHRDGNGSLWITEDVWLKPKKDPILNIPYRESDNIFWFGMYRHLFECIGKRRRIRNRGTFERRIKSGRSFNMWCNSICNNIRLWANNYILLMAI